MFAISLFCNFLILPENAHVAADSMGDAHVEHFRNPDIAGAGFTLQDRANGVREIKKAPNAKYKD
jgi:hypothetical protein